MNKTNCPNCGAPFEVEMNKCPFCGTSYFDLSSIDFDSGEPCFLKLKTNGRIVTQKVFPRLGDTTIHHDTCDITGSNGEIIRRFTTGRTITTNISFQAVPFGEDNSYITIQIEE